MIKILFLFFLSGHLFAATTSEKLITCKILSWSVTNVKCLTTAGTKEEFPRGKFPAHLKENLYFDIVISDLDIVSIRSISTKIDSRTIQKK
jgi:hypothetical protein